MIYEKAGLQYYILSRGNFPIDEEEMSAILLLALAVKDDVSEYS